MSDFIPQLPSNRPKVDLDEQERIIAEWKANGGKVKTLPSFKSKPRPTHKPKEPRKEVVSKARQVIARIQSEQGLSERGFRALFTHNRNKEAMMAEVKQVIVSQFGLKLVPVKKFDSEGNIKAMMGLR